MSDRFPLDGRETVQTPVSARAAADLAAIRIQLQRVLESPPFRTSKRCRLFLEHVTEHALTNGEPLKERSVGVQVFGREPSYDTSADPIVRVTAGDIRRRLGQYYAEPAHQRELRVDLPSGTYNPSFTWPSDIFADGTLTSQPAALAAHPSCRDGCAVVSRFANGGTTSFPSSSSAASPASSAFPGSSRPARPSQADPFADAAASAAARDSQLALASGGLTSSWSRRIMAVAGLLAVIALLGGLAVARQPATTFDRFWAPLIQSKTPVLVCTGSIEIYELPGALKQAANAAATHAGHEAAGTAGNGAVNGSMNGAGRALLIEARDVQRVGAGFVSVADAVALVRLTSLLQEHGTPFLVRENRATSFADLRTSPVVLLGMFSNAWTLQLGSEFRFVPEIDRETGRAAIRDRHRPGGGWQLQRAWPRLVNTHDYALVSRVLDRATGTVVVIGAGITPFGTTAAAEFLTSRHHLEAALRDAPADWPTRNLQVVLETRVIDGAAAPPQVLATHVW